jgi:hypothetical protein
MPDEPTYPLSSFCDPKVWKEAAGKSLQKIAFENADALESNEAFTHRINLFFQGEEDDDRVVLSIECPWDWGSLGEVPALQTRVLSPSQIAKIENA